MITILTILIKSYQKLISPLLGQRCRFYPSCSNYALKAIESHGVLKGTGLSALRLLRCQPFSNGGIDLVPEKKGTI